MSRRPLERLPCPMIRCYELSANSYVWNHQLEQVYHEQQLVYSEHSVQVFCEKKQRQQIHTNTHTHECVLLRDMNIQPNEQFHFAQRSFEFN